MTDDPRRLPDDLAEIASHIPVVPEGLGPLRQLLALLPPPLGTTKVGAGLQILDDPQAAAQDTGSQPSFGTGYSEVNGNQVIPGSLPGTTIAPGSLPITAFASGIVPPRIVSALPTLPDATFPAGSYVWLTTDKHLYKTTNGTTWGLAVDAGDIVADSITAGQIAAGAIGADEIAANAVTAGKIAAGSVTADKLLVGDTSNLVTNAGFETGDLTGWLANPSGTGSVSATSARARGGKWCAVLSNGASGTAQLLGNDYIPVSPGEKVTLSLYGFGSSSPNANITVAQYDASKNFLSSTGYSSGAMPASWQHYVGRFALSASAFYVRINLTVAAAPANVTAYIDDVVLARGAVAIDSAGIHVYDGSITLEDQYGATVLDSSGFGLAWQDFIHLGVYNGVFSRADPTANTLDGWAISNGTYALDVAADTAAPGGNKVHYVASGVAAVNSSITSDYVACSGTGWYTFSTYWKAPVNPGNIQGRIIVRWYDSTQALITSSDTGYLVITDGFSVTLNAVQAPVNARYYKVLVLMASTSAAGGTVDLYNVTASFFPTTQSFIPPGTIVLWSGTNANVPAGWYICDGSNGTPDLRDRFIVGDSGATTGAGGSVSPTGGLAHSSDASHAHTVSGGSTSQLAAISTQFAAAVTSHDHSVTGGAHQHGAHSAFKHYKLAYIMKS